MRSNLLKLTGIFLLQIAVVGCGESGESPGEVSGNVARAQLLGVDKVEYGEVIIAQGDGQLIVNVDAKNMPPGPHGIHIHTIGKCEGPDFKSAEGHWNPTEKEHGFENTKGAHRGDFFNLDIGDDGTGSLEATIDGGSLKEGEEALLDSDGAAFVVHEGPDDLKSDPSGESGGRLACGVFVGGR